MTSSAPTKSANFQLSAPLGQTEYCNAFYTIIGVHDLTVVFLQTNPLMSPELEKANADGVVHVKPVATVVLARSAAIALANQILQQTNANQTAGT
jgi:hypothetical protein